MASFRTRGAFKAARLSSLRRILLGASCATIIREVQPHARAKSYKAAPGGKGELLALNSDFDKIVAVDTSKMDWVPSPMPNVERKRVFLHGTKEAGKVTSVVRYASGSRFHKHPHPEGEEFLVLSGVFSDHSGDYGPMTYCMNPEGFEHAPSSEPGCEIIVRLRQHPNLAEEPNTKGWLSWLFSRSQKPRTHTVIAPEDGSWVGMAGWGKGVTRKLLYEETSKGYEDSTWLERIPRGTTRKRVIPQGMIEEVFVVEGMVSNPSIGPQQKGAWVRHAEGESVVLSADGGSEATLYVRQAPVDMIKPQPRQS